MDLFKYLGQEYVIDIFISSSGIKKTGITWEKKTTFLQNKIKVLWKITILVATYSYWKNHNLNLFKNKQNFIKNKGWTISKINSTKNSAN